MELKRLNAQISRLRNFRVGMAVFLMILTVIATLAVVWLLNRETINNAWELKQNGLVMKAYQQDGKLRMSVVGAVGKAVSFNDKELQGVGLEFPLK
jgi:hypothetical protein